MTEQLNIVCGADIHQRFLIATILCRDGRTWTNRFSMNINGLLDFKTWLLSYGCQKVAVESTGRFWIPVHMVLEGTIDVIVANAYKIKHTTKKKTDLKDSEWLAELCLNDMIEPSRIFPKEDRELRNLTRAREAYVRDLSKEKNRVNNILESCSIKLASVISDIFGKSGMHILNGLLSGICIEEVLRDIPDKRVRVKKSEELREALTGKLEVSDIFLIRQSLQIINQLKACILELDEEIRSRIASRPMDLKIAMSIPGIGMVSAYTILAEVGNYMDFRKPEQLAMWAGIVPSVYQSADKLITGSITKQGSKHLRWILVQVAHAITHKKGGKLKKFFLKIKGKKGYLVAIVALARKVICILHHLLVNQEMYEEEGRTAHKDAIILEKKDQKIPPIEDMIHYIIQAGYKVKKIKSGVGG
ncbi:MAG: IS110 family transposase [Methanotrichaceae archaeon]|nr:IS110 family transposase [Methanotrichaceae archaeon]